MSIWRVLGGAAIGVGAIAAAPFTGGGSIVGAATLLGSLASAGAVTAAVGAGVVGAAIVDGIGEDNDNDREAEGYAKGKKEGLALNAAELEALGEKLEKILNESKQTRAHFDNIIAMEVVAIAVAQCDGDFSDAEREEIDEFICGLSGASLPGEVREILTELPNKQINIKEAFTFAQQSSVNIEDFDCIIQMTANVDGVHHREEVFMAAWNDLKKAA